MRCGHSFPLWFFFCSCVDSFFGSCVGSLRCFSLTFVLVHFSLYLFSLLFLDSFCFLELCLFFMLYFLSFGHNPNIWYYVVPPTSRQYVPTSTMLKRKNMNRRQKTPNNVTVWRVDTQIACARSISSTTMRTSWQHLFTRSLSPGLRASKTFQKYVESKTSFWKTSLQVRS